MEQIASAIQLESETREGGAHKNWFLDCGSSAAASNYLNQIKALHHIKPKANEAVMPEWHE